MTKTDNTSTQQPLPNCANSITLHGIPFMKNLTSMCDVKNSVVKCAAGTTDGG